ncbi:MAG: hypothetical protein WAK86_13865 [Pseudonocardiaceae bacterium]
MTALVEPALHARPEVLLLNGLMFRLRYHQLGDEFHAGGAAVDRGPLELVEHR